MTFEQIFTQFRKNREQIESLKEEQINLAYQAATQIFDDGDKVIYIDPDSYHHNKRYLVRISKTNINYQPRIFLDTIWGPMVYVSVIPLKKDGEPSLIGATTLPVINLKLLSEYVNPTENKE